MKILVTGGAGYIGSVVSEQLIREGHEVVVFDNLYQGHCAAVPKSATFIKADLSDRTAIDLALRHHRPEAVMHFAAYSLVGESMQQPFKYLAENVSNAMNLLQSMIEHGVKKLAFRRFEWVKRIGLLGAVRPQPPHRSPRQAFRGV